ncbi:MAG: 4-alpha-glucanotransferase [Bacilli bacterium]|jgi:4-alpha-glucanotransferase
MRTNGILMAVSSLPGEQGIGDFGDVAFEFVDLLKKAKIKIWQVLPLNPVGYGNSPYQSECGEALDPIYISLSTLVKEGYLKSVKKFNEDSVRVDYEHVREFKDKYLRLAFKKEKDTSTKEFKEFVKSKSWLENYAKFHILFLKNNYQEWNSWELVERYDPYKHQFDYTKYQKEILFIEWCQFIAYKQFLKLREYANKNGVALMGDIPFYVGGMSSDVWSNQDDFLLDDEDQFTYIAGVPPDYFSATGQRWGNPIYDWAQLKKDKYDFWMNRFKEANKLYDILRIDHFRAFDSYWKIPVSCPTAIEGTWEKGPGTDLFDTLKNSDIKIDIVAEDLGDLFPSVLELKDHYGFPGMYVLEFNFLNAKSEISKNQIVYTGTHDNDTLLGWFNNLHIEEQNQVKLKMKVLKVKGKTLTEKFLNYAYSSISDFVITPMQDFLELGSFSRMNTPGTCCPPNWEFKIKSYTEFNKVLPKILALNTKSKRI